MSKGILHSKNFSDDKLNPCLEEGELSKKCMKENFYDSAKCRFYFENYKACRKFWYSVKRWRGEHGIMPFLPGPEERMKILKEREKGNKVYQCS